MSRDACHKQYTMTLYLISHQDLKGEKTPFVSWNDEWINRSSEDDKRILPTIYIPLAC